MKDSTKECVRLVVVLIGSLVIVLLALPVCCLMGIVLQPSRHPTDEQLIANYTAHRTEFNQLAQMLLAQPEKWVIDPEENNCKRLAGQGQDLLDGASNQKCAEYLRLFKLLSLPANSSGTDPLYLHVSRAGLFSRGTYKGYVYASKLQVPPGVLVDDTQHSSLPAPRYRHIEGNWYIYFE